MIGTRTTSTTGADILSSNGRTAFLKTILVVGTDHDAAPVMVHPPSALLLAVDASSIASPEPVLKNKLPFSHTSKNENQVSDEDRNEMKSQDQDERKDTVVGKNGASTSGSIGNARKQYHQYYRYRRHASNNKSLFRLLLFCFQAQMFFMLSLPFGAADSADVLVNSKLVNHDGFDDYNHCDGTKETMITSKYTHFDDSVREWCMHAMNIPRSNTDYKKISMRPCNDSGSNEKKRIWFIDSDAFLRLKAHPSTCVKYIKKKDTASERVGLGICNPSDDASMHNAVRVYYHSGTLSLSATVDGMGGSSSKFWFEVKHYPSTGITTRKARRHRSEIRLSNKDSSVDPLKLWAFFCLPSDEVSTQDTLTFLLTCTPAIEIQHL